MTGTFMPQRTDMWSSHYEKSTPPRKGRLDTCLFAVGSHKACLSAVSDVLPAGPFAGHGFETTTHARTNGGLADE